MRGRLRLRVPARAALTPRSPHCTHSPGYVDKSAIQKTLNGKPESGLQSHRGKSDTGGRFSLHQPAHSTLQNRQGPCAASTSLSLARPASRSLAGAVPKFIQALSDEAAEELRPCVASFVETGFLHPRRDGMWGSVRTAWGAAPAAAAPGFREQSCAHKAEAARHSSLCAALGPLSRKLSFVPAQPCCSGASPAYNMQEK